MKMKNLLIATLCASIALSPVAHAQVAQDAVTGASGGSGSPGGSSGSFQYNNAGSFGGFQTNNYVSGNWYPSVQAVAVKNSVPPNANTISCYFGPITQKITINSLGAGLATIGSSNTQFAMYTTGANGRPAALIGRTNNIANNTSPNSQLSGALAANKEIGPGGADGDVGIWWCSNQNDNTAAYAGPSQTWTGPGFYLGFANISDVINGDANNLPSGIRCSGAQCQGGSSTFNTWPASLATTTWDIISPGTSGNWMPIIIFKVN